MIDLHTHSTASDGECTPTELVRRAAAAGLQAIALTDHDTVDGVAEFTAAAEEVGIEAVAGIEISCSWYDGSLHLLGLLIDPKCPELIALCKRQREERTKRLDRIVANLAKVDVHIEADNVRARANGAPIGRPHIADELIAVGACETPHDAYQNYLGDSCRTFSKAWQPLPKEAIAAVHAAGGVAVHAHPAGFGNRSPSRLRQRSRQLKDVGLDGLEAWYGSYLPERRQLIAKVATELDLVTSGGSDFHGDTRNGAPLGTPTIDYAILEGLRERQLK
jgi:predicted metal-dependent phosphoesterase TrpH